MENLEFECKGCGECCHDTLLQLSSEEAIRLRQAGTDLSILLPPLETIEVAADGSELIAPFDWSKHIDVIQALPDRIPDCPPEHRQVLERMGDHAKQMLAGEGLFHLLGRCAFLTDENTCGAYDERPRICVDFTAGEEVCLKIRSARQP